MEKILVKKTNEVIKKVEANGTITYKKNGNYHRVDGPAIEQSNGNKTWYLNGELHRADGPAVECANGDKQWFLNGQLHRADGPACEYINGAKNWYINGERHRADGPAVEFANGNKLWYLDDKNYSEEEYKKALKEMSVKKTNEVIKKVDGDGTISYKKNGKYHREDGPAIESNPKSRVRYQKYFINGKLHREDGPAHIEYEGKNIVEECYFINGKEHRLDGPSRIVYDFVSKKKKIISEDYMVNGKLHRLDGPALIDNEFGEEEFYINGNNYPNKMKYEEAVKKYLAKNPNANSSKKEEVAMDSKTTVSDSIKKSLKNKDQVLYEKYVTTSLTDKQKTALDESTNKETRAMSNDVSVTEMLKNDMSDAAVRIASTQMTKAVKSGILLAMEKGGNDSDRLKTAKDLLDSEVGTAIVSMALGMVLKYVPQLNGLPHADRLSEEFRISSMATAGNTLIDQVMTYVGPAIMQTMSNLPALTQKEVVRARVSPPSLTVDKPSEHEEDEEMATPVAKTAKLSK